MDIKMNKPEPKKRKCGNCIHYGLIYLEELHLGWSGPWVCRSEIANPKKEDIAEYYKPGCENWEY